MDNVLKGYIEKLKSVDTVEEYETFISNLHQMLKQESYKNDIVQTIRNKQKYIVNKFSKESTHENMLKSKENLLIYLDSILCEEYEASSQFIQKNLEKYLRNFYFFLEAFRETKPDKRASLTTENLRKIHIENEYDLQHLLYAVIKPLCPDARKEVSDDSGVGTVRSDIKIFSLNTIIEAKCTRISTNLKRLTEEIEADIVHYKADYIFFYIYDKEKIIKDRQAFETNFNRSFDGKEVRIIILQPVNM